MRQALISSVAAVAILGHAALGCCWHHAHAECSAEQGRSATRPHQDHDHSCTDDPAAENNHFSDRAGENQGNEPDHEHLPCQDSSCIYVTTKSVELSDSPALPVALELALTLPAAESCNGPVGHHTFLCSLPAFAPQHCALTQVWLL